MSLSLHHLTFSLSRFLTLSLSLIWVSTTIFGNTLLSPLPRSLPFMADQEISLTIREQEVLGLIVNGLTDQQIAHHLNITVHTVNAYRKKLLRKLHANNVASLVRIAIQQGLFRF